MAIIETHPSVLPRLNSWRAIIRSLLGRYAAYRAKRQALAQLRGLDAGTLKDIAIARSELSSVVLGNPDGRRRAYRSE